MGREEVRRYVEQSDCVLMLGAFMTDINLGVFTARLNPACCIAATSDRLSIRYHNYDGVGFQDFLRGLLKAPLRRRAPPKFRVRRLRRPFTLRRGRRSPSAVCSNGSTRICATTPLSSRTWATRFWRGRPDHSSAHGVLGTAYYASMGFAVPAAIGAQLARPERRPLVLVGDGAFQMTGMELTTAARYHLNPIVIVLNNAGYGTERRIQDGPYNDVAPGIIICCPT